MRDIHWAVLLEQSRAGQKDNSRAQAKVERMVQNWVG